MYRLLALVLILLMWVLGEMRNIRNAIFLTYPGKAGSDTQLCDLPSCKGFEFRRCVSVSR